MKRSDGRILTTHTGSLPRAPELVALIAARERGEAVDANALAAKVDAAVRDMVGAQVKAGLHPGKDGEESKADYSTYIKNRLSGFDGKLETHPVSRDARDFPEFFASVPARLNFSGRPS